MPSARLKQAQGPPEASIARGGRLHADLATPKPGDQCYVCGRRRFDIPGELARLFGRWVCRDRVDCYKAWRPAP